MSATPFRSPEAPPKPSPALLLELLQKLAAMSAPGAPTAQIPQNDPARFLRGVVRASFAQDARGRRLRDAWRVVGTGLLDVLRELSAPDAQLERE